MMEKERRLERFLYKIKPIHAYKWRRATRRFLAEQARLGHVLRGPEVVEQLARAETLLLDAGLVMEGWNAVRMAAAPLELRAIDQFRHQSAWMMLTAGISLGCEGYGPLEAFAREMNFANERMARQYPQVERLPFDVKRRIETTIHQDAGGLRAFCKGEPEAILYRCIDVLEGSVRPMERADRQRALEAARGMEAYGLETLSFATKWQEGPGASYEEGLVFLGTVGMGDLTREEVPDLLEDFHRLGKRTVLMSDQLVIENVLRASGILRRDGRAITGGDLETMGEEELRQTVRYVDAAVSLSPRDRMRLIRACRAREASITLSAGRNGGIAICSKGSEAADLALVAGELEAVRDLLAACGALYAQFHPEELIPEKENGAR